MTSGHYAILKKKHRELRHGFPESVSLRVHRSLSWLQRAEQEISDPDVKFVLLWIGFNAAYAGDVGGQVDSERGTFATFFGALVSLDRQRRLYDLVWARFPHEIRLLLDNKYVFSPFWAHQNGAEGYENWPDRLEASKRAVAAALRANDTVRILSILFDRLYILRNQLVHGGATWGGGVNRDQVRDGAALLHGMLPIFVDLIMDFPNREWGRPYYPVVE
jgi:hypothetical protein